jgi:hypothetical protein
MGARAKEMFAAQLHRKDIFLVWVSTQRAHADAKVIEELGCDLELNCQKKKHFQQLCQEISIT